MKIRTGFVSNSSSSSFVIYGWRVDFKVEDEYKFMKDNFENNFLTDDGPYYVGVILADIGSDDDPLDDKIISLGEIITKIEKLRKKVPDSAIISEEKKPKFYIGTRSC